MALSRLRQNAHNAEYLEPSTFPAVFEFQVLHYLSVSDLSSACRVSSTWYSSASNIVFWKAALNYKEDPFPRSQELQAGTNWIMREEIRDTEASVPSSLPNRLLGGLINAIKLQDSYSVRRLLSMGARVNGRYQALVPLRSLNIDQDGFLENPGSLGIAAIVSSEQQSADIIYLLLRHGADVFEQLKYRENEQDQRHYSIFAANFPSKFVRDERIKALLQLEEDTQRQRDKKHDAEEETEPCVLNSEDMRWFFGIGLSVIGAITLFMILAPIPTLLVLLTVALLCFLPCIVSTAKDAFNNYMIRRNFHNLLSSTSTEQPNPVVYPGRLGLFSKSQIAKYEPQINTIEARKPNTFNYR